MQLGKLIGPELKALLRDDPDQVRPLLEELHAEDFADIVAELTDEEARSGRAHV